MADAEKQESNNAELQGGSKSAWSGSNTETGQRGGETVEGFIRRLTEERLLRQQDQDNKRTERKP